MWFFSSLKRTLLIFISIVSLVAVLFWLYLNIQASVSVSSHHAQIHLPESLPTKIHVGNYLQTRSIGKLDTSIDINRQLDLPLRGKYLAELSFEVETPITVNIDYSTMLKIDETMPLETTTDLIYQNKLLPQFPLKLDIPIQLDVPFQLKRSYTLPVKISFSGPVYFEFNEPVRLNVRHQFNPTLNINDPMTMRKIATFNAIMYNSVQTTQANLDMQMNLPLKNIHP
ncbi:hypothetical protein IAE19_07525 [Acinetobacter sp. S40]|uniref:hypothetical protein n=1 Tax=Acinetobacter sp. S40 TaxID=2767434 RepID=UPI001909EDC6|nr:hypothetical protein [Acinetobacter sp. S40]MBJ9985294.1 hypothetical protein [Acinetobacter sp. S40]